MKRTLEGIKSLFKRLPTSPKSCKSTVSESEGPAQITSYDGQEDRVAQVIANLADKLPSSSELGKKRQLLRGK